MTKRGYYNHPYTTEFTAQIIKQTKTDKGWEIVLDETYFYPEGGGQAADSGTLNGIPLQGLYKIAEGDIVHIVKEEITTTSVTGKLDWEKRFRHMQQHSGQHVLSAALFNLYGLQTMQAKFDAHEGTILLDRPLTTAEINQVLVLANQIVFADKEITTPIISLADMQKYPLVKLPKEKFTKEGMIRIWHIPDYYTIPCGGTHVKHTGEIGTIFITKQLKEGSHTKVFFTTGYLTLSYLSQLSQTTQQLQQLLSTSLTDLVTVTTKKLEQHAHMEKQLKAQADLVAQAKATQLQESIHMIGPYRVIQTTYEQEDQQVLKPLLFTLTKEPNTIVIATSTTHPLAIACTPSLSPSILQLLKDLLTKFQGKGGGNLAYWQAVVANQKEFVKEFLARMK